jgi:hypothetical protein
MAVAQNPPSTEVLLFDLNYADGIYSISNPRNISQNKGYDNQPSFLPDNSGILFSSAQDGQTEVVQYDLQQNTKQYLTHTEGSEYSPVITPNGHFFSCIRLEKDGNQLLYKYPVDLSPPMVLVEDLKIGYHCWINDTLLAAFVLGDPNTLQICNLRSGTQKVVYENIGRSLHKIPESEKFSFISKTKEPWTIRSIDPEGGRSKKITHTLEGSEDMAWTPDGIIIQGKGSELYQYDPSKKDGWIRIADLEKYKYDGITRLAVSTDGKYLAMVVNE